MDLCKDVARSTFIPGQLRHLYKIPKLSPEFELAFAEFYDNVKREKIIDNLHGARLQEFVDFLDEVRGPLVHSSHRLTARSGAAARRVKPRPFSKGFAHLMAYLQQAKDTSRTPPAPGRAFEGG